MATLTITQPITVELPPMNEEEFFDFCQRNRDLRIERTAQGEIIIMAPNSTETGRKNSKIAVQLGVWAEEDGRGESFDSSTGFTLPNGAMRSPDAAWASNERLAAISEADMQRFAHLSPEFAIELMSQSDSLRTAQLKMQEWIESGAELGWLIDPFHRIVYEYTRDGMCCFEDPSEMKGHDPVAGFILDLDRVWKPKK